MCSWRLRSPPKSRKRFKHARKGFDKEWLPEEAMMINNINNNEAPGVSRLNLDETKLDQTSGSSRAAEAASAQPAGSGASPVSDSISLSNSPNLVQQALSAGASARSARVQQLKALVESDQYQPSGLEVSRALISAHIAGD
jgi:anti-sigma28 factor (negative regulator of flagellin synthesis)